LQPSFSGVAVSLLVLVLTADISSTFCDGFMIQRVKLILSRFLHFLVLLFDCFACQNVTCQKHFTRYKHYAGEIEDMVARLTIVSYIAVR